MTPEERAAAKRLVKRALGQEDELLKHRDWCDYRLDALKGLLWCRPCDCPQDNDKRNA